MPVSETDIFNMAFDLLDEEVAIDPLDDREPVRRMNRDYPRVRDEILRSHPWNFALARTSIPEIAEKPAFGWNHQYQLPADCLRLLPPTCGGFLNGHPIMHELEGRMILTDEIAPLKIRYVKRIEDTGLFDPLFTRLLAATLATNAANWITGKQSYAERLAQLVQQLREHATLMDALEGTPQDTLDDDPINVRFT